MKVMEVTGNLKSTPQAPPQDKMSRRSFLQLGVKAGEAWGLMELAELAGMFGMKLPDTSLTPNLLTTADNAESDFFFVYHLQSKDLAGFADSVQKNDVIVPELIGWSDFEDTYFNAVSQGTIPKERIAQDYGEGSFMSGLLQGIYNSKKKIAFLDVPEFSMLSEEYNSIARQENTDYTQTFGDHARTVFSELEKEAAWHRDRENYILDGLTKLVRSLRQEDPVKYAGKIKVLLEYGVAHTRLLHILDGQGVAGSDNRYPAPVTRFSNWDEAKRRYWFNEDTLDPKKNVSPPTANLIGSAIMEEMLKNWFYVSNFPQFPDTATATSWLRDVASLFSMQEVYGLWEYQRQARQGEAILAIAPLPELRNVLAVKLREKRATGGKAVADLLDDKYIKAGLALENPTENPHALLLPPKAQHPKVTTMAELLEVKNGDTVV